MGIRKIKAVEAERPPPQSRKRKGDSSKRKERKRGKQTAPTRSS
jgi:hypothetical protein